MRTERQSPAHSFRDRQPPPDSSDPTAPSFPDSDSFPVRYSEADPLAHSVETNADHLMDEVFDDVERLLDQAVQIPIEPIAATRTSALQMASVSEGILPPKLSPRELTLGEAEPDADLILETLEESALSRRASQSFDKLLLMVVGTSVVVTGVLWLIFQNSILQNKVQQFLPWSLSANKPQQTAPIAAAPTTDEIKQQQNNNFLSYVERSLDRLDRVAEANKQVAVLDRSASPTPTTAPAPTVLERVYIPVYQPPQGLNPAPQPALAPTAPASSPSSPTVAAANTETHVLIGIMELGSRSAALFEINGTPQRIQVGEAIGSSGWTLVSIRNQEAVVRQNGNVRSIYVGQKF